MTWLDSEKVRPLLRTSLFGKEILYVEEATSTNDLALRAASQGAQEGYCVIAERQTRGRGRLGRVWYSPPFKNLYLSLVLRPKAKGASLYPFSFLSCLSVQKILRQNGLQPSLKWPNDVLLKGRKVSGTLIELEPVKGFAVVGVGINVNMAEEDLVQDLREIATSLYIETGRYWQREQILAAFLNTFEDLYALMGREGARGIVTMWEKEAKIEGKSVSFEKNGSTFTGIVRGLSPEGALIVDVEGRTFRIHGGELIWYS